MRTVNERLASAIEGEIAAADELTERGDHAAAFHHLERAHVLGQASTYQHTRVHWRMFRVALKRRSIGEVWGQIIRIVGASTKTPFGIYPTGNTGGANVWFFQRKPVPDDLKSILEGSEDPR